MDCEDRQMHDGIPAQAGEKAAEMSWFEDSEAVETLRDRAGTVEFVWDLVAIVLTGLVSKEL